MKKKTISSLKKKLWKIFSVYIRNRDKNICVLCGNRDMQMNASHYIAKAACNPKYYFSELNVHSCCVRCNLWLEGNRPAYRKFILNKYGEKVLLDLETQYNSTLIWSVQEYEDKIKYYSNLIK